MTSIIPDSHQKAAASGLTLEFDDNTLFGLLCGAHDEHLARLEKKLDVTIVARGNRVTLSGDDSAIEAARAALAFLYERLKSGRSIDRAEVDAATRLAHGAQQTDGPVRTNIANFATKDLQLGTRKRQITPRSPTQADYVRAMQSCELTFGLGPAGTGKTYLAVAMAVTLMQAGQVERLILSRPAVEAGEKLGFLPGDLKEKVDPYLRPLYDALFDMLPGEQVAKRLETGEIEVAPLAFMRGRTLSNAFVIMDEAQNTTPMQMKMLLTRLGENSRMVVTGDLSQIDLPRGVTSGLRDALEVLETVDGVGITRFGHADVVRHDLVSRIVHAYDSRDGKQAELDLHQTESPAAAAKTLKS